MYKFNKQTFIDFFNINQNTNLMRLIWRSNKYSLAMK